MARRNARSRLSTSLTVGGADFFMGEAYAKKSAVATKTAEILACQISSGRGTPRGMAYDPEQRREAMEKVMEAYGLKVTPWAIASRVSRGTLQAFLIEKKTQSLGDEMYERLADGARALTGADITAATLRGEAPFRLPDVDVKGYVGAGEKITPIDDLPPGEGIRMVPCPIGLNP